MQQIEARKLNEDWGKIWADGYVFEPISLQHDTISVLIFTALRQVENSPGVFLDVGSGPGSRTIPILREFPFLRLVLLDTSQKALSTGKEYASRQNTKADLIKADAFKIPLPDCSVKCVFSNGLNEHFQGDVRQQLFDEMVRVAEIGGSVVVITPNKLNPFHTMNKVIRERRGSWIYGPQYDFTPSELIGRVKNAGLVDIKKYGVGAFTSWIRLFPRNLQRGIVISPTPIGGVNRVLQNLDMDVETGINRLFGREIMVIGRKAK
ncbi:hypothetical protein COZ39_01145 [Candidatus Roizmanbacteria bacterium CG_4_10_14_3_um_filter_33_21]|uniref:Methyltransferase domain-containing protein n=2 Tax=Candidatus Roizmaniibacteriota TaxID=1752723 RepID=A0A2H0C2P9_9BACT|nr:MAG: hypothetical protein COW96_04550 [Candidatus Roizmanbacteria bacterium CG22_combo_CG10-13_8_21_14_all_33_16]PIX74043.1 MAG: hypothetical protein COZ39_01145 [Candidatus Roizmanbacteria bacterium CG_4_10_14_3_um_filter_33_21]